MFDFDIIDLKTSDEDIQKRFLDEYLVSTVNTPEVRGPNLF